ncbi:MAG: amidohydrolase family protein [Lentisphaerae bacterium]|nr:amidohydrolase family protein [Lentisphaerota bacterium]
MILDFHAAIGRVPTAGRNWKVNDALFWAERCLTDVLLVEHMDNAIHRDDLPHDALLAACRNEPRRLLAAATVDLRSDEYGLSVARSARKRGFAAVVLRGPLFEESRLLGDVLAALRRAPLPIYRPAPGFAEWDALYRIARSAPEVSFVLAPNSFEGFELAHRLSDLANVYFSIEHSFYALGQIEKAVRIVGAERVMYAGDFPYQHPARPLGVVFDADIAEVERETILSGAALKLLKRHGIEVPDRQRPTRRRTAPCAIVDIHGHLGADRERLDCDRRTETVLGYLERGGGEALYVSSVEGVFGDVVWGNTAIAEAVARHPQKLRGYAAVNPHEGPAGLDEMRRCHALGFIGLKPYPCAFEHDLADPIMDPVWDLTESFGWPALCHPRPGNAEDLRRVLAKRPKARLILAHMTTEYRQKAEIAREFPNAIFEISGAGATLDSIAVSLEIAGPQKLVFGSDLCIHPIGFTLYPLLCSGLAEDVLRAILRENALGFFHRQ